MAPPSHARGRFGIGAVLACAVAALDAFGRETLFSQLGVAIKPDGPAAKVLRVIDSVPALAYSVIAILLGLVWCFYPSLTRLDFSAPPEADEDSVARNAAAPRPQWKFTAEIRNLQLIGKLVPGRKQPTVFGVVHLRIKNLGADSLTEDWRVSARAASGAELDVDLLALDAPFELEYADGRVRTYREEHCIYVRAQNAIKSGDRADGILVCTFNGISHIAEVDPASVAVTFYDVAGNEWTTDPYDPAPPIASPIYYDPGLPNAQPKTQPKTETT